MSGDGTTSPRPRRTSTSQPYRHVVDTGSLVPEVIALQADEVLARQRQRLESLDSIRGLELWGDDIVRRNALGHGVCAGEPGSPTGERAAGGCLEDHVSTWQGLITAGLARMVEKGVLRQDADAEALAIGLMAALQGGYLLARTARDAARMKVALDMALEHVKSFAAAARA